jgi:hypothetical protein
MEDDSFFKDDSPQVREQQKLENQQNPVLAVAPMMSTVIPSSLLADDAMLLSTPPLVLNNSDAMKSSGTPGMNFDEDIFDIEPVETPVPDQKLIGGWAQLLAPKISTEPPTPQIKPVETVQPIPLALPAIDIVSVAEYLSDDSHSSRNSSPGGWDSPYDYDSPSLSPRLEYTVVVNNMNYLFGANSLLAMNEHDLNTAILTLLQLSGEKTGSTIAGVVVEQVLSLVRASWAEKKPHLQNVMHGLDMHQRQNSLHSEIESAFRNDVAKLVLRAYNADSDVPEISNKFQQVVDITEKNVEFVWMNEKHKERQRSPRSEKKARKISEEARSFLLEWFNDHISHPYPTEEEKEEFSEKTGLTKKQIKDWFVNARMRYTPKEGRKKVTPKGIKKQTSPRSLSPV